MQGASANAYRSASAFLVDIVQGLSPAELELPGLGRWSLRELVAHANRAHLLIEEYLLDPKLPEPRGSSYFSEEAITARAEASVALLGDDPAAAVARSAARAVTLVDAVSADSILGTPFGPATLDAYLPSRTAELTIHAIDLLRALGRRTPAVPSDALAESLAFAVTRAAADGRGEQVLLALSGRDELPGGFSIY